MIELAGGLGDQAPESQAFGFGGGVYDQRVGGLRGRSRGGGLETRWSGNSTRTQGDDHARDDAGGVR